MKIVPFMILLIAIVLSFTGCSDSPSSGMKNEQYEAINNNAKKILGDDFETLNFSVTEEGFTDNEKTSYTVKFTFDLNKPVLGNDVKKIPGRLIFNKDKEGWKCTFNSGNALGLFNIMH
jgi:nitrogen fixation-related uncharacterized protein